MYSDQTAKFLKLNVLVGYTSPVVWSNCTEEERGYPNVHVYSSLGLPPAGLVELRVEDKDLEIEKNVSFVLGLQRQIRCF